MNRREFFRTLGFFSIGLSLYVIYKNLTYLSRPPSKRIFLSTEELKRFGRLYLGDEFILIKKDNDFSVYSRRCPHLGCKLNYDPVEELITCPCHKSKFNLDGKYLEGPAKRDLNRLSFDVKDTGLQIDL
ncbi:MAG: Rieske (2Fe-2S) protein [Caldimicrobium sp.]|nr:Rieske (2Fe-2S) protein [Caldimicrobium sp.]MCX7613716.1 Rieske (2Fe-2S) protein [Caldimicrobium sp.]MDW8183185.1 Rieske (2Fe-2S) protein [Caldimicrobium sp.]